MPTSRKEHWEKIYAEKKPGEVSWFQQNPEKSLELILSISSPQDDRIIDVGGGASVLVDKLLKNGFHFISVLDISEKALQYTKERLGSLADKITWITEDVTTFNPTANFDLWHDRAVFHFLTEKEDREKYVSAVKKSLKKDGYLIIATFAKDGPDKCSNLPVRQYDLALVQEELGNDFQLVRETFETHVTPWGKPQKFSYFLFKKLTE